MHDREATLQRAASGRHPAPRQGPDTEKQAATNSGVLYGLLHEILQRFRGFPWVRDVAISDRNN